MKAAAVAHEALARASSGQSVSNYGAIFHGFADKGIAEPDIRPRENVFTFHAWRALGRTVRKGEHGVRVCTFVPIADRVDDATGEVKPGGRRPKTAVVFHLSQTDSINGAVASCPQCCGAGIYDPDHGTSVNIGPPCNRCDGIGSVVKS
jgi:hypothetical protein